jgi:hypothetical protein
MQKVQDEMRKFCRQPQNRWLVEEIAKGALMASERMVERHGKTKQVWQAIQSATDKLPIEIFPHLIMSDEPDSFCATFFYRDMHLKFLELTNAR